MAKIKKKKRPAAAPDVDPEAPAPIEAPGGDMFHALREIIESVAVAFVLAFLFRTFVAEAFVIPTGSMSPALQGRHMDVDCAECGYRFRVTASNESPDDMPPEFRTNPALAQTVGGMCPMCRYLMPFRPDLRDFQLDEAGVAADEIEPQKSYPGDRIVVSKFGFDFTEPERWDVVVFKYPGDGNMNYIKRLTGLPGDSLRVYQGDVFVKPPGADDFSIARREPSTLEAMLQPVHDSRYEPSELYDAGWPLRWAATTPDGWQHNIDAGGQVVEQSFVIDATDAAADTVSWLRYRHLIPHEDDWQLVKRAQRAKPSAEQIEIWKDSIRPELITDFNPYNARLQRNVAERGGWRVLPSDPTRYQGSTGYCWVGDLAVECEVEVEKAEGELLLDVVEAGFHFRVAIALDSGAASCSIIDGRTGQAAPFSAKGQTSVRRPGVYDVRLANIDDELHLWVNGEHVDLGDATWNPADLVGDRADLIPWSSDDENGDQGDLAPAGVGARGASLMINRLAVFRDTYYVAAQHSESDGRSDNPLADYPYPSHRSDLQRFLQDLLSKPSEWDHFRRRRSVEFSIGEDQFFVMGDNSPESLDARLWTTRQGGPGKGYPGGNYVDRRLLIGKAVAVFWPHSWGEFPLSRYVPGLSKLPGWPNFEDMRLVR